MLSRPSPSIATVSQMYAYFKSPPPPPPLPHQETPYSHAAVCCYPKQRCTEPVPPPQTAQSTSGIRYKWVNK